MLDPFDEYNSHSLRYVKQASEKTKDRRLEKIQVKILHQRSPYAIKFEDSSQQKTEKTRAMRPRQGMESCQTYLQAQKRRTKLHSIRLPISGLCRPHPP